MVRTYVAFDLEATGMQPERDEVIEIGAVKFRDGQVIGRWESFVRPSQQIPYKVQQLTGIKPADVARAPHISQVAGDFIKFVGDSPVIGQSVELDLAMLARHGVRLRNVAWDTFELATLLVPEVVSENLRYNLYSVAKRLGVSQEAHAHRAVADAELTMRVFLALRERIEELPLEVLSEIGNATKRSDWPLRLLFQEVEHEKARTAFSGGIGSSIRAQLQAKGLTDAELDVGILRQPDADIQYAPVAAGHEGKFPLDHTELENILKPGGAMSKAFAGYEYRPQQLEMTKAVASALNKGRHLIVEAGTGTGKSLGYLLPAVLYALRTGEQVVVSTNTINLQDQLFTKDLPLLHRVLEGPPPDTKSGKKQIQNPKPKIQNGDAIIQEPFHDALMKGKGNYICLRRWYQFRRSVPSSVEQLRVMVKVLIWLPQTETGDRNELLLLNEENDVWGHLKVSEEGCPPFECRVRQKGLCFFDRARRRAYGANIIVVNHALLMSDLAMGGGVLPEYDNLIIDEAHNLEDEATDALGFTVDRRGLVRLLEDLSSGSAARYREDDFLTALRNALAADISKGLKVKGGSRVEAGATRNLLTGVDDVIAKLRPSIERARQSTVELFGQLNSVMEVYQDEQNVYDLRQRITNEVRRHATWGQVEMVWDNLGLQLKEIEDGLSRIGTVLGDVDWDNIPRSGTGDVPAYADMLIELRGLITNVHKIRADANAAITNPDEGAVYWLEARVKGGDVALKCAPLHVGELLDRYLFSKKRAVVLTSATLSTDNDFSYISERLGLHSSEQLQLSSPFDYQKSALVYVPTDMPEPATAGYQRSLEQALIELCKASQGRALVLFTSHSAVRTTYRAIQRPLEEAGIMVLGHNIDGSRRQLLERFKNNPKTVLLGTSSFWEGIDVVGDALSVLVIAKLPFAVPTDPVFAARAEGFEDAFLQYSVPQAILKFKQGFGRLIRSRNDRGVVAVLDRRVISKRYGQAFLNSLPEATIKHGLTANLPSAVADWLRQ
ncbi:MAG: exonuclease domain-containing protein [Chloroflexota bacterium]|nr:exonuclease domain-containing protein [Chloroflexota bacterium]